MAPVVQQDVPASSLLRTCREGSDPAAWDHFSDCFGITVDRPVSLPMFVHAFYTSPVFRAERLILRLFGWPSTDGELQDLLDGRRQTFAAWRLAGRTPNQLLMADALGRTRSWFCVTPHPDGARTLLQFGSGVAAGVDPRTGQRRRSLGFRLLGGFHVLYSRALLAAAASRLRQP